MQRLRNPRIGIDQGDLVLFSEFDSGGQQSKVRGCGECHPGTMCASWKSLGFGDLAQETRQEIEKWLYEAYDRPNERWGNMPRAGDKVVLTERWSKEGSLQPGELGTVERANRRFQT